MLNYVLDKNGKYVTNDGYQEIIKLHEMLEKANIPHTFKKFLNGWQVCYPTDNRRKIVADAVEHYGSY